MASTVHSTFTKPLELRLLASHIDYYFLIIILLYLFLVQIQWGAEYICIRHRRPWKSIAISRSESCYYLQLHILKPLLNWWSDTWGVQAEFCYHMLSRWSLLRCHGDSFAVIALLSYIDLTSIQDHLSSRDPSSPLRMMGRRDWKLQESNYTLSVVCPCSVNAALHLCFHLITVTCSEIPTLAHSK